MEWSAAGHAIQVVFDELFLSQTPSCCEDSSASDMIDRILQNGCLGCDSKNRDIAVPESQVDFIAPLACSDTTRVCPYTTLPSSNSYGKYNRKPSLSVGADCNDLASSNSTTAVNRATKLSLSKRRREQMRDIDGEKTLVSVENKTKSSESNLLNNLDFTNDKHHTPLLNDFDDMPGKLQKPNGTVAGVDDLKVVSGGEHTTIDLAWGTEGRLIQEVFDDMFNHVTKNTPYRPQNLNFENSSEKPVSSQLDLTETKSNAKDNLNQQLGIESDALYSCNSVNPVGEHYGPVHAEKVSAGGSTIPEVNGKAETERQVFTNANRQSGDNVPTRCDTNNAGLIPRNPQCPSVVSPVQMLSVKAAVDNSSGDSLSLRNRLRPRRNLQPIDRMDDCHAEQPSAIDCAADVSCYSDRLLQSDLVIVKPRVKSRVPDDDVVAASRCTTQRVVQLVQKVRKTACVGHLTEHTKANFPKNKSSHKRNKKQSRSVRKTIIKSRNETKYDKNGVGNDPDKCSSCEDARRKGRNKRVMRTADVSVKSERRANWNCRIQKQTLSHGKSPRCYEKPTGVTRQTLLASSGIEAKKPRTIRNVPPAERKPTKGNQQRKPYSRYIAKKQTSACSNTPGDKKQIRVTRKSQPQSYRNHVKKQTRPQNIPLVETETKCSRATNSQVSMKRLRKTKKYRPIKSASKKKEQFKRPKLTMAECSKDRNKQKEQFKRPKLTMAECSKDRNKQKEQFKRPKKKTLEESKKNGRFKKTDQSQNKSKRIMINPPQKNRLEPNSASLINDVRSEEGSVRRAEHPAISNDADLPVLLPCSSNSGEQVVDWLWTGYSRNTSEQNDLPGLSGDRQLDCSLTPLFPATRRLIGLDNLHSHLSGCRDNVRRPRIDPQSQLVLSQGLGSLFSSSGHAGEIWKSIV